MHDQVALFLMSSLALAPLLAAAAPTLKIEKVAYKGWPNCYRITNSEIELIVTSDVGPRIIRFGFVGGENEFKEYPEQAGQVGGTEWRIYGGHRLWHAPEAQPRTYAPDNSPVQVSIEGDRLRAVQAVESTTGIQKEMEIRMASSGPYVEVLHRLRNKNLWAVELAPWAPTVMAPGGRAIIPMPPRGTHPEVLEPTNPLIIWAYTDLRDSRWTLGFKYLCLRQDPSAAKPQKIGAGVPDGWGAYARNGHLFVKKFQFDSSGRYPDFGSSLEVFTNADMLEVETLGPLATLEPNGAVEHLERWSLFRDVRLDSVDDDSIDRLVLPLVREAR
jgi:hypothetical protein